MLYDWYYRSERDMGRTVLTRVVHSPGSLGSWRSRRVTGEDIVNGPEDANLVFRSVRGATTCADTALHDPMSLPTASLRLLLEGLDDTVLPRVGFTASAEWAEFRRRCDVQGSTSRANAIKALRAVCGAVPDRRLGTASLVAGPAGEEGLDALITERTRFDGCTARVVGELLEIWSLNALYKQGVPDSLLEACRGLIALVARPDDVRTAWWAHLARSLAIGIPRWEAQIEALDLAHAVLGRLWDDPAEAMTSHALADLASLVDEGKAP